MSELKPHPAADLFPMMDEQRLQELAEDIAENGLREPIVLLGDLILDGRNRAAACRIAGVEPRTEKAPEGMDPYAYVWSLNGQRRDLIEAQRYLIWKRVSAESEAWQEAKKRIREEESRRKAEAAKEQHNVSRPWAGETKPEMQVVPEVQLASQRVTEAQEERPKHTGTQKPRPKVAHTRKAKAKIAGVGVGTVAKMDALNSKRPDLAEKVERGEMGPTQALRQMRKEEIEAERAAIAHKAREAEPSRRYVVHHADLADLELEEPVDVIITDPPYPREFLPLWSTLARKANEWLKPGGLVVAMSGQAYLDEVYRRMSEHLAYYWTACYHTPGQPTPLRHVNTNTTWKPLLIYRKEGAPYKGKIFGDFMKSDQNEKEFHKWGQSISGMDAILERFALPGQTVMDPFCGAGTTGISAIKRGCLFVGCEIEERNVEISIGRISEVSND